jgi:hypothetical protein
MSQLPSNSEQFSQGMALGAQNLGIASQNQQAKIQRDLSLKQLAMRGQEMEQGERMQMRQLGTETQNNREALKSREGMQSRELDQTREQANIERLIMLRMKKIDMDAATNELNLQSLVDNSPELLAARARSKELRQESNRLEELMAATMEAQKLATTVQTERGAEVDARLSAYSEGMRARADTAGKALAQGYDYAVTKDAGEGSFWQNVDRLYEGVNEGTVDPEARSIANDLTVFGYETPQSYMSKTKVGVAVSIMMDNALQWLGADPVQAFDEAQMTEFKKNGAAMGSQIIHNALTLNSSAFGLDPGQQARAADTAVRIVSNGALLARVGSGGGNKAQALNTKAIKEEIAKGLKGLRDAGMGDEQITALFNGLEGIAANRDALLTQYTESDPNSAQAKVLNRSLTGLGRITDQIRAVMNSDEVMKPVGGKVFDHSKFDYTSIHKKAKAAYGLGNSEELAGVVKDLDYMQMNEKEKGELMDLLTKADPRLSTLSVPELTRAMQAVARMEVDNKSDIEDQNIMFGQQQTQAVARGRAANMQQSRQALDPIESFLTSGGR